MGSSNGRGSEHDSRLPPRLGRWLPIFTFLSACSAYDPALLQRADGSFDAATGDGATMDAQRDEDASGNDSAVGDASNSGCVPSDIEFCPEICPEMCNGLDDDCDNAIDEEGSDPLCTLTNATATCVSGICLVLDCTNGASDCDTIPSNGCEARLDSLQHCGFCFARCNFHNATARCDSGNCALDACLPGFGNCDGNDDNGCEFRVDSLDNCGGCGVMCPSVANGQPGCINLTCAVSECDTGFQDCDGDLENGCETSLDATDTCGGCDTVCSYAHAMPVCAAQVCVPGSCLDGYSDCDGDPLNECEISLNTDPNNCGACGRQCDPGGVGGFACVAGECVVTSCAPGLADCDSDASNGCETSTRTLTDCSGCGITCAFDNSNGSCDSGTCTFTSCQPGYGNCNGMLSDGCETSLDSGAHCGACGAACGVNDERSCSGGICSLVSCTTGSADCDNDGLTCEQSLNTIAHCGACNARCGDSMGRLTNASASCGAGSCAIGSCDANFANCDSSATNGCETSLRTTASCGDCGVACSRPNASVSCATGTCAITACNSGFGDCDGNANNGCEVALTSLTHCGACNNACALTNGSESCTTGTCTLGTCDGGYGNCDFIAFNGCEAPLNTTTNCSSCGTLCDYANGSEICTTGTCTLTGCSTGFGNCDANEANGCEQALNSNTNCGGCNVACSRQNAAASCGTGTCTLGACNTGFGNCDGNAQNGCETPLNTMANCGACGAACGVSDNRTCNGGVCSLTMCTTGTADCDNDGATCEQSLYTLTNCGGCGVACGRANAAATCPAGTCTLGACNSGFGNCDSDATNGCEQAITTNNHCGGCDVVCERDNATTSCSTGTCTLGACNPGFGNCDGNAANGCETALNSLTHCGGCNVACSRTNAAQSCGTGTCTLGACDPGFGNCDGVASNGCETPVTTLTNCSTCGSVCDFAGATESCASGTCTFGSCQSGFGNCDTNQANGCEAPLNTLSNCGGCNVACSRANASQSCATGSCVLGTCDPGFGNCDSNAANGCELALTSLSNCGGCNVACSRSNATATCGTGTCTLGACNSGFGNCDSNAANGCEAPLTSLTNCGGCNVACTRTNANADCGTGTCTLGTCTSGFGNCDSNAANGCETPLTSLTHCAGCNVACARNNATATCSTGSCALGACNSGYGNCDSNQANGCETQLNSDTNCGACGTVCNTAGGLSCVGGSCILTSCTPGTGDCDNDMITCEQSLNTLNHCGACNVSCSRSNASATCATGTCALGSCNANFGNCDGNANNGCEQSTLTTAHCGACGVSCSRANATASCASGTCTLGTCNAGYGNCDGNAANGCETQLNTLTHCGACNAACDLANAGESCATGTCALGACNGGFGDCDLLASTGCETPLNTNSNCNVCSAVCDFANATESCSTGSCAFGMCSGGYGSCDGNPSNGCEQALTNNTHCAACNTPCARANASASCGSGTCALGTCNTGFGNCDANAANGCETTLGTMSNCGSCGNACAVDETCTNFVCQGSFTYTPSNFNPVGIVHTATPTLACGVTIFNSTTQAFTNWCSGQPLPSITTRTQSGGPDVVVLGFSTLTISNGATLQLIGSQPVILAVFGNATINGTIDASGSGTTPGAGGNWSCGGSAGGNGGGSCNGGGGGGGGGGHATNGAAGGSSGSVGAAGAARGTGVSSPLIGGCNGGNGGGCATQIGGGGGGAVQVSAAGTLTLGATGRVLATGGAGLNGGCSCSESGGGGGGSGGAVLLEGDAVSTVAGATITANGGRGGNGVGGTAGGNGGTGTTAPVTPGSSANGAGGGGGAVGRGYIRGVATCSLAHTSSISAAAGGVCPPAPPAGSTCALFAYGGHNYYFCTDTRTWDSGRTQCQSIGFELVRINDANENAFVLSHITADSAIGANDKTTEGNWRFNIGDVQFWSGVANGTVVGGLYNNWNAGEPNQSGEQDCGVMYLSPGTWDDGACSTNRRFVCESL